MNNRTLIGMLCAAVLTLAACGGGGSDFSRADAVDDMVEAGFEQAEAECITDGMIEQFGIDTLESLDDPTDEEIEQFSELAIDCVLGG